MHPESQSSCTGEALSHIAVHMAPSKTCLTKLLTTRSSVFWSANVYIKG